MVMRDLSGFETLLDFDSTIGLEIVRHLAAMDGRPDPLPVVSVVGFGALHAHGKARFADALRLEAPDGLLDPSEQTFLADQMRAVARELKEDEFEWSVLSLHPGVHPNSHVRSTTFARVRNTATRVENEFRDRVRTAGLDRRTTRNTYLAHTLSMFVEQMISVCRDFDISDEALNAATSDPKAFLAACPTLQALADLRLAGSTGAAMVEHDFADVLSLSVAIPVCDVVAPDKAWAALVHRCEIDTPHDIKVVATPRALADTLVSLAEAIPSTSFTEENARMPRTQTGDQAGATPETPRDL